MTATRDQVAGSLAAMRGGDETAHERLLSAVYGELGALARSQMARERAEVKVLRPDLRSPELMRRFLRERQIVARLDHPSIVRLRLLRSVGDPLHSAQQALVVHSDLPPGTILVTPDGTPELLDLGIARLMQDSADGAGVATRTGSRLMTPDSPGPEQVRGEDVGAAGDQRSLEALLHRLLTGRRSYAAPSTPSNPEPSPTPSASAKATTRAATWRRSTRDRAP